ncbi:hydroxymethylcytosylglucuronate/cytosylglucuronate synthase [Streptomyces sp. NPDC051173]|uniref:hydroxymethylcytosylglucuronate/cytosylglucurona te synthase n=1 Tax=Streptomyces sp. NPDC051173 TaxID=3155164 RepID=UPI00344FD876
MLPVPEVADGREPDRVPAPGRSAACGEPVTVAVAGVEFGWGSSGKLSAVLSALRERSPSPLRFVGLASRLGRPVLAGHGIHRWYDLPDGGTVEDIVASERVRAAVVVLDGPAATALEGAGVPTVFVDSLPFMWSEGDRSTLPLDVTAYCAQQCLELPPECRDVLASVRALRWVEAVIGTPPVTGAADPSPDRPYRRALISLGGLRAPRLTDWSAYPTVVVPAALGALAAHGVREAHVAGNLPADLAGQLIGRTNGELRVTAGALSHGEFLAGLADFDVLLASPGLTTLLEAGSLRVPTVCLPPQNLSQIFNGRFHSRAVDADVRVVWPKDVFCEDEALALRSRGEDEALDLIYGGIGSAGADAVASLQEGILTALLASRKVTDWGALTAGVGAGGAAQVADALLAILGQGPPPA